VLITHTKKKHVTHRLKLITQAADPTKALRGDLRRKNKN
jgi:hypothetical protein